MEALSINTGLEWSSYLPSKKKAFLEKPLHNVLHVPSFITNLISISALRHKKDHRQTNTVTLHLTLENQQFSKCTKVGKLFALEEYNAARKTSGGLTALVNMNTPPLPIDQAHCCIGHLGEANLRKLATIAEIEIYGIFSFCKVCILAKIIKTIIRSQLAVQCRSWIYFTMILLNLSLLWGTIKYCIFRWPQMTIHA